MPRWDICEKYQSRDRLNFPIDSEGNSCPETGNLLFLNANIYIYIVMFSLNAMQSLIHCRLSVISCAFVHEIMTKCPDCLVNC